MADNIKTLVNSNAVKRVINSDIIRAVMQSVKKKNHDKPHLPATNDISEINVAVPGPSTKVNELDDWVDISIEKRLSATDMPATRVPMRRQVMLTRTDLA